MKLLASFCGIVTCNPGNGATVARRERCLKQPGLAINDGVRATLNC
jgi:hypothetical protein